MKYALHYRMVLMIWSIMLPVINRAQTYKINTSAIYIWSDELKSTPLQQLKTIILKNNFNKVFVSSNNEASLQKKIIAMETLLSAHGIDISYLIGYNNWMTIDKDELAILIAELPNGRYHLDIEPHVFPDWKENKLQYQDRYLYILQIMSMKGPVSVSLPYHYERDFLESILKLTKEAYIMLYGQSDFAKWNVRLEDEISLTGGRIHLAFSARDYNSKDAMRLFISTFCAALNCEHTAIHSLKSWIALP